MKIITFKKIFSKTDKYGIAPLSIIMFRNDEYLFKTKELTDEEARSVGYKIQGYTAQYRRMIKIDLFICVIEFDWLSREKK